MSVELIDEQELVEALHPFRPDRNAFERGLQDYLRVRAALAAEDPARDLPPLARAAAAVLPLPLLTGGKISSSSAISSGGLGQKLLGVVLFPAVSLFVLLGATILSVLSIRRTSFVASSKLATPKDYDTAIRSWWREHWLPAILFYGGIIVLAFFDFTGWYFPLLIVSFGMLVAVVRSLARLGLGNRTMLAGAMASPLILIGQVSMSFPNFGDGDIHLLDPKVVSYVFWLGLFFLGFISLRLPFGQGRINRNAGVLILFAMYFPIAVLLATMLRIPPSPEKIQQHVEAFDRARFGSATWRDWEILARWTIEAGLRPDLSKPRKLFEQFLAGKQDPFTLGIAFRVGLVTPADLAKLHGLEEKATRLLDRGQGDEAILSLDTQEWVIRALLMGNKLDDTERDFLAGRLHATIPRAAQAIYGPLSDLLLITQLLEAIDRPVDPERHRELVHATLLKLHCTESGGFRREGGFKASLNARVSDDDATAQAVELMQIYGVPAELDLNWVRSYTKPRLVGYGQPDWITAVTRARLAAIPGVQPPTLGQWLYYERNLVAAVILVGLCIYAVWISPVVQPSGATADLRSSAAP
jgi:hypothetical protein